MRLEPVRVFDPELNTALVRDGLCGLDRLLALAPRAEPLPAAEVAAIVRLLRDACGSDGVDQPPAD